MLFYKKNKLYYNTKEYNYITHNPTVSCLSK